MSSHTNNNSNNNISQSQQQQREAQRRAAQAASRAAYLSRETHRHQHAAAAALRGKLSELEDEYLTHNNTNTNNTNVNNNNANNNNNNNNSNAPSSSSGGGSVGGHSLAEVEELLRRADRVESAAALVRAAQQRKALEAEGRGEAFFHSSSSTSAAAAVLTSDRNSDNNNVSSALLDSDAYAVEMMMKKKRENKSVDTNRMDSASHYQQQQQQHQQDEAFDNNTETDGSVDYSHHIGVKRPRDNSGKLDNSSNINNNNNVGMYANQQQQQQEHGRQGESSFPSESHDDASTGKTGNNESTIVPPFPEDKYQKKRRQLEAQRRSLPIFSMREELLNTIYENQAIVIVGETGSGKTTQLLQYLYEEGFHIASRRRELLAAAAAEKRRKKGNGKSGATEGTASATTSSSNNNTEKENDNSHNNTNTQTRCAGTGDAAEEKHTTKPKRENDDDDDQEESQQQQQQYQDAPRTRDETETETERQAEKEEKREGGEEEEEEEEELRLLCTQPRRIAATSVAERVAREVGVRCGGAVGYRVRFDDKTSAATRLVFMTDGLLLKELAEDPDLSRAAAVMIDEAHERSLNTDILLGLLKDVMRRNRRLRVIIASATINAERFSEFFNRAPIVTVTGRTFPVDIYYSEAPVVDYVKEAAETVLELHLQKPLPGDILVFLPGQDAIEACAALIGQMADARQEKHNNNNNNINSSAYLTGCGGNYHHHHNNNSASNGINYNDDDDDAVMMRPLIILPLYSTLPPREQALIYDPAPPDSRKVVLATNIAETSITIDGVVHVVDCGLCKQSYYNARAMMEELVVVPTSQASAAQRAGRAGRTRPGECYRLYTPAIFKNDLPPDTAPEIARASMTGVVLQLKALGIHNIARFEMLDAPAADSVERALDHLYALRAIRADGRLTVAGRRMAELPLEPSLAAAVVRGCELGCGRHAAAAAAMASLESIFLNSRDPQVIRRVAAGRAYFFSAGSGRGSSGDLPGYVRILEEWLRASGGGESDEQDNASANFMSRQAVSAAAKSSAEFCARYGINAKSMVRAREAFDQLLRTLDRIGLDATNEMGNNHNNNDKMGKTNDEDEDEEAQEAARGYSSNNMIVNEEALIRAFLSGYFFNVSKIELDKRSYRTVRPLEAVSGASDFHPHLVHNNNNNNNQLLLSQLSDAPIAEIHPSSYLSVLGGNNNNNYNNNSNNNNSNNASLFDAPDDGKNKKKNNNNNNNNNSGEKPKLVFFLQLRRTRKRYMMHVTAIPHASWAIESAPEGYFTAADLSTDLKGRK